MSWLEDISALPDPRTLLSGEVQELMRALMLLVILASFVSLFYSAVPASDVNRTLL